MPDVGLLETVHMRYYLSKVTHYTKIPRFFLFVMASAINNVHELMDFGDCTNYSCNNYA